VAVYGCFSVVHVRDRQDHYPVRDFTRSYTEIPCFKRQTRAYFTYFNSENTTNDLTNDFFKYTVIQTNDISSTKIPLNYTEIYENILNEISAYCISDKQYEELYSNKLRAGLVSLFFPMLLDNAIKQIGLSEFRDCLKLKKQKINLDAIVKEEFEEENRTGKGTFHNISVSVEPIF